MALTAAERQKRYRERNGCNADRRRINLIISASAVIRLDELARQCCVHKQVMLERVIFEYGALLCNDAPAELDEIEVSAGRWLDLAGGKGAEALALLTAEAKKVWPGFTWSRAAGGQVSAELRHFLEVRRYLQKMQKQRKAAHRAATTKEHKTEEGVDQLTFAF